MKTVGVICEYNPFHLGHARQFHLIRQLLGNDTRIVCVMSGNYVQRGMPAMWDKSVRAAAALHCGADLVLELPITGVLQSAEGFARAGVDILSRMGCVDILCFGAKCGSAEMLMEMAKRMDDPAVIAELKEKMEQGLPYAAARQAAIGDDHDLLRGPNNILGLEYCRAIVHLNSNLIPMAVTRNGDYHAFDADQNEPSATAVRNLYPGGNWKDFVPEEAARLFDQAPWYHISFGERALLARLRGLSDEEWMSCAHGTEGLWSKAMHAARSASSYEAMIDQVKSKRYPRTRIQRLLLCAYLGLSAQNLKLPIPYVRILAANEFGRDLLRIARKQENLLLINAGQTPPVTDYYRLECRTSDLYTLFSSPSTPPLCQTEQKARIVLR